MWVRKQYQTREQMGAVHTIVQESSWPLRPNFPPLADFVQISFPCSFASLVQMQITFHEAKELNKWFWCKSRQAFQCTVFYFLTTCDECNLTLLIWNDVSSPDFLFSVVSRCLFIFHEKMICFYPYPSKYYPYRKNIYNAAIKCFN